MTGLKRSIRYWTWIDICYILCGIVIAAVFGVFDYPKESGIMGIINKFSMQLLIMGFGMGLLAQILNSIYVRQSLSMGAGRKNCFIALQYQNVFLFAGFYLIDLFLQRIVGMALKYSDWTVDIGKVGLTYLIIALITAGLCNFIGALILRNDRVGTILSIIFCAVFGGVVGVTFALTGKENIMGHFSFLQGQHVVLWILGAIVIYGLGSLGQYFLLRKYEVRV